MKPNPIKPILTAWLLAGTLDILAAFTQYMIKSGGKNPIVVLQFIASGAVGREAAFAEGYAMAALGLAFHYCFALGWTLLFYFVYPRLKFLSKNLYLTAFGYGIVVWIGMTRLVIPLSRINQGEFNISRASVAAGILIVCVALPISLVIGKYYNRVTEYSK
ncbi:MAG: hypothetical protein L0Y80_11520 [Ignavibacteriae bacterium]|nr:hypothetical protein [Ignavibacteriota bacterium]